jgi:hypothetical protein
MQTKITQIIKHIEGLYKDLEKEYQKASKDYGFSLRGKKIIFLAAIRKRNKKIKENAFHYVFTASFRHLLSIPFIWAMILPIWLLDIGIWIYQTFTFPLYGIPKVKRRDYIIYDRKFLSYLNVIQKVNCIYCTYANGLFAYAVEVGARTERYWCPIKAAKHPRAPHSQYAEFADYGDAQGFKKVFNNADKLPKKQIQKKRKSAKKKMR